MAGRRIHQLLADSGNIVFPGVFDALSALMAQRAGFSMAFVSGYSVAATMLGEPDMGLLTQTEMVARARTICSRVEIPILVDADTGYGNPLNVHRTVRELIDAGAAGCFLEDQVWPKRCGHMSGKQLISAEDYGQKIRAAVDARGDRDFFIVARTDALAVEGMASAIDRVSQAREYGADASFVEAPQTLEQLQEVGKKSPRPNVANMISGGRTPVLGQDALRDLGFDLVLHPLAGLFSVTRTLQRVFDELFQAGTVANSTESACSFDEFNSIIGADQRSELAERFKS